MSKNSFKELEEKKMAEIGEPPSSIKTEIDKEVSFFRFVGDMIELYLSKLLGALSGLTEIHGDGSNSPKTKDDNKQQPS